MARKSVKTRQIEDAQSLAASFQTDWISIPFMDNIGFVINCNSVTDNTGTFGAEVRMVDDAGNASEAVALTLSSVPTLADEAADFFLDLQQIPATQVRVTFTAAGGTPDGNCDIWVHSKTIGG